MNRHFEIIRITRNNFTELVDGLTIEQLNQIPAGFNNNIAWNFGHVVVTTQGLCYWLSGLPFTLDTTLIDRYKKGSRPEGFIPQEEIDLLKLAAQQTIDSLEADYHNGIFQAAQFTSYTTSFNTTLNTIEDAIAMVQSHDALHYGYAQAQRKLV